MSPNNETVHGGYLDLDKNMMKDVDVHFLVDDPEETRGN